MRFEDQKTVAGSLISGHTLRDLSEWRDELFKKDSKIKKDLLPSEAYQNQPLKGQNLRVKEPATTKTVSEPSNVSESKLPKET